MPSEAALQAAWSSHRAAHSDPAGPISNTHTIHTSSKAGMPGTWPRKSLGCKLRKLKPKPRRKLKLRLRRCGGWLQTARIWVGCKAVEVEAEVVMTGLRSDRGCMGLYRDREVGVMFNKRKGGRGFSGYIASGLVFGRGFGQIGRARLASWCSFVVAGCGLGCGSHRCLLFRHCHDRHIGVVEV